ncbi:MAG: HAMP domain-containing sensor histidine kinase [Opitutus sp.]
MIAPSSLESVGAVRFRTRLLIAMMLVVSAITAGVLYVTQRKAAEAYEQELQHEFQAELAAVHGVQEIRHAALVERCRALVRRPRIHAALEDNALDLLYPSAKDELRDVMLPDTDPTSEPALYGLHAEFYRFLDHDGAVIRAPNTAEVGELSAAEEAQLALPGAPLRPQLGYLVRQTAERANAITEVFAMPIVSTETGEPIAAIVLGFKSAVFPGSRDANGIKRGMWLNGRLQLDAVSPAEFAAISTELAAAIPGSQDNAALTMRPVEGARHLLFFKQVNPGSAFPAAYEVCVYSLAELREREQQLRWSVLSVGAALLLAALAVSHLISGRLSRPVEKLAVDSAEHLAQRVQAEARLEVTNEELQRAARFSADASHQLKTPVTVLRAGLEELLTHEKLTPEECHDISALIHQTHRLSGVIEDLLLLSRMDAGRLKIEFRRVNLTRLIEAALDDLSAQPGALDLEVESDLPGEMEVSGEDRYVAMILQNLLENARKYNRPGGKIRIRAKSEDRHLLLCVANTGRPIAAEAREHIFERFHRGKMGENVPGYGLGLNLARELARLHGGDLKLLRSDSEWTEFEVHFLTAVVRPSDQEVTS